MWIDPPSPQAREVVAELAGGVSHRIGVVGDASPGKSGPILCHLSSGRFSSAPNSMGALLLLLPGLNLFPESDRWFTPSADSPTTLRTYRIAQQRP